MKIQIIIFSLLIGVLTVSCNDKTATPKTVKFTAAQSTYSESSGTVSIPVSISEKETANVTVTYSWSSPSDTTYLGGDFVIDNIGTLVITAGQTSGIINLQIIDDTQVDGQDDIKFTITAVSGGSAKMSGTASDLSTEILINDNDTAPTDKLQVDITWHLKDRTANINGVNLDLYSQYDVSTSGGSITDGGLTLRASENTSGFETIFINPADADQVYYFAINYLSGSSNLTYTLTLRGMGFNGESGNGTFASSDSGYASFWGPFTKSGSSVTYTGRTANVMDFKNNGLAKLR
jgi:hypothetical protein